MRARKVGVIIEMLRPSFSTAVFVGFKMSVFGANLFQPIGHSRGSRIVADS